MIRTFEGGIKPPFFCAGLALRDTNTVPFKSCITSRRIRQIPPQLPWPGPMTRFVLTSQRSALINPRQNGPVSLYFLSTRRDNQPNQPRIHPIVSW